MHSIPRHYAFTCTLLPSSPFSSSGQWQTGFRALIAPQRSLLLFSHHPLITAAPSSLCSVSLSLSLSSFCSLLSRTFTFLYSWILFLYPSPETHFIPLLLSFCLHCADILSSLFSFLISDTGIKAVMAKILKCCQTFMSCINITRLRLKPPKGAL